MINPTTALHQDRRQFTRVEFDADVSLTQGGKVYTAGLVDISLNGVLVETPGSYQFRTDIPCGLTVKLSEECIIEMQATLVHSGSNFLGFHCTSIGMESIVYLRRLIEINMDDPGASDRVLTELVNRQ